MPQPLRIVLCGGLVVELGGSRIEAELAGRQGRQVFGYLVLNRGRKVSRDELTALLWPEHPPQMPEAALNTILARLRRVVGHSVLAGRALLTLELPAGSWIDVEEAEAAAVRADALVTQGRPEEALREAVAGARLVAAPLLPEMQQPWVDQRQIEVDEICVRLLSTAARCGLALGGSRLDQAERAARRLIEREPFRESGYGLLMEVHSAGGDVAEALMVYERLRSLLINELGIPPSPTIAALHERLLQHRTADREVSAPPPAAAAMKAERPKPAIPLPDQLARTSRARLVGREVELSALRQRWSELCGGDHSLVAIRGESGIGKTMLTATFAGDVHAAGGVVLFGQAQEESIIPCAPLVEALRHYVVHAEDLGLDGELEIHLSELGWLIPELASHGAEARPATGDPRLDRIRLYQAVAALLRRIAASCKTLLVLEDMHWADKDTVGILRQLLRETTRRPVLTLITFQDAELTAGHPLAHLMHDARRDLTLTRIKLQGLDDAATAELLRDDGVSEDVARQLRKHTSGIPLFIEELARSLRSTGKLDVLPESVQEVIQDRLRRLAPAARQMLAAAAVLGPEIDVELLEAMVCDDVRTALDVAVAAGLLADDIQQAGGYRFRHALAREAICGSVGQGRRSDLHYHAAVALDRRRRTSRVNPAELARHYFESGRSDVAELAIRYSCEAAERASAVHAYEDAIQHLGRAIKALEQHRADDTATHCTLLLALGKVCWQASGPEARTVFEEALSVARRSPDHSHFAEATLGLGGRFYAPGDVNEPYVQLLQDEMASAGDERLRARLLARLAEHLIFLDPGRARRLSGEALALARSLQEPRLVAATLLARHGTLLHVDDLDERIRLVTEQLELAHAAGEPELEALGLHWLLYDLFEAGERASVAPALARQQELADELGQPLYRHSALVWQRGVEMLEGNFERAVQLASAALNLAQRAQGEEAKAHFVAQQLEFVEFRGGADRLLPAVAARAADGDPLWAAAAWHLALACGDRCAADRHAEALTAARLAEIPRNVFWLTTLTLAALATADAGDRARAAVLYDLLEPYAERYAQLTFNASFGSVHGSLAALATVRGEARRAAEHYEAALERHAAIGSPVLTALTCCDYVAGVRSGLVAGSACDASALAERAARLADEHGATAIMQRVARASRIAQPA